MVPTLCLKLKSCHTPSIDGLIQSVDKKHFINQEDKTGKDEAGQLT